MLFQSSVPQVFNLMGQKLYSTANNERKAEAAKRLNFYHDAQSEYLSAQLEELFAAPEKMLRVELNITAKIINNLAQLYCQPPVRTVEGTDRDKALFSQIVEDSKLNLKLKMASRYTKLLKNILLRVVWRDHIEIDIITPNLLDVTWLDTPEQLESVMITDFGQSDKPEDVEYSLWTASTFKRLNYKGDILFTEPNPYKRLPFIAVFDSIPTSKDFWQVERGESLISIQQGINVKLVDLLHLLYHQSFGVGFIRGQRVEDEGMPIGLGPGSLVELPEGGEIGFVSQRAEISQVVNAIDKLLKWACVCNGLSAAAISTDPNEASGVSKIWDSVELSEMRTEDKITWSHLEKQLFDLIRTVQNTHGKEKISKEAILGVNFSDPLRPTVSPLDEAQSYSEYYKMGVMSPVDVLMQKDKDLRSREEALQKLQLIKQENEALNLAPQGVKLERV